MNCIYTYKNHKFNSESELDDFIIEKLGYESKFGDIIFSRKPKFLRIKDIVENKIIKDSNTLENKMRIAKARSKASYCDGERVLEFDRPYIGVNRFLSGLEVDGKLLFPEFRIKEYFLRRRELWTTPLKAGENIRDRFSDDEIEFFFNADNTKTYSTKEEEFLDKIKNLHLLSEDECDLLETLMERKWEFQAAAGTAVHFIFLEYFTKNGEKILGDSPRDEIIEYIKNNIDSKLSEEMGDSKYRQYKDYFINDKIINDAILFADNLKVRLRKKYGEECEFYPEISITSQLAQENPKYPGVTNILGIIDLLVIDEKGLVHYFDYKTSPKPFDKFDSAKKLGYQYLLALYGKLLKRYGIEYRNADISILPILFDNLRLINKDEALLDAKKSKFTYDGLIPKVDIFETETRNKILEINSAGEEKILDVLDAFVPEEIVYNVSSEDTILNVSETEKQWFPEFSKYKAKSKEEIKQLLEDEGALNPKDKDGKQVYIYLAKGAYSKEIVASSPEELIEKVEKYLNKIEKRSEFFANIVIRALKQGTKDIGPFLESIDSKSLDDPTAFAKWFAEKLGLYCNGCWKILEEPSVLKNFGIVALENKITHQIDIIKLSNSNLKYNPFETKVKNGKRIKQRNHLLTYAFLSDINENSNSLSLMLEGYKGNIELIETVLVLNEIPDLFESKYGAVIGNIQVINPFHGTGMSASNEEIMYSFKKLSQLSPLKQKNNVTDGKIKLATTFDVGVNAFNEAMESTDEYEIDNSQFNSAKSLLDVAIKTSNKEEKIKAVNEIIKKLESAHLDLKKGKLTREMLLTKPYARLYNALLLANRALHEINFRQLIKDHDKWLEERSIKGIFSRGISGTYTDNPGNMQSDTLNTVAKLVTQAYQSIRNGMSSKVALLRKATEELKKEKGYTGLAQTVGNATDMYKNMTEVVDGDLLFTDLKSSKLNDAERKYLKLVLEIINENRFGGKKSKKELEEMRDSHNLEYYRVPLCIATSESLDSQIGLKKGLLERLKRFSLKGSLQEIREKADGFFTEEKNPDEYKNAEFLFDMNNRFDKSEIVNYRLEAIAKKGAGYFERNLEMLAFKHTYAYLSSKELNKVFPIIKSAMAFLTYSGNTVNSSFEKDEQYLEDYIKSSIQGRPIEKNEKMQLATAVAGKIKQIASFMALAFSPVQGTYLSIQGIWQDILLVFKNLGVENTPFTFKNLYDAFITVWADILHVEDSPSKCLLINEWLGVNDMDMNIYAERMRTDLHNKYNFVNFAYKFASRPDYYNRMTIIVAKMKAEGVWDALEVKDGKLVYNFKKDKRFEAFVNGRTSDPNYNNQRALYIAIGNLFINENTTDLDGNLFQFSNDMSNPTPLPYPWTNQESESVKSLCDMIYGYYSHEKKSLIHATFLGSLFMQMKTYWSGKKNQYFQPGGVRLQGEWVHAIDPESKKPLYYSLKDDGTIDYDGPLTTTPTNSPFYRWEGKYLEGIMLTLHEIFANGLLSKEGLKQGWDEVWNNEDLNIRNIRRANIRLFGFDLVFYMLIGMLLSGFLLRDLDKDLRKKAKNSGEMSDALLATLVTLTRASLGNSTEDLAWWESIGSPTLNWSPFALVLTKNTAKRFWNTLFGDLSFYDGVTKSFAATKQILPLVDFINPKNL